jgi:hypothetical protein
MKGVKVRDTIFGGGGAKDDGKKEGVIAGWWDMVQFEGDQSYHDADDRLDLRYLGERWKEGVEMKDGF